MVGSNSMSFGTLTDTSRTSSEKIVVCVHGLAGYQHAHMFYNAARFFAKKGIATFRFDLYSGNPRGRLLRHSTLRTHAQDLNRVIAYLKRKYKQIYLVGHSFGGLTIFLADTSLANAIILWDPSHSEVSRPGFKKIKFNKGLQAYIFKWGIEFLIGRRMHREIMMFPDCYELIARISVPLKIISADGILTRTNKEYFKHANEPKKFVLIPKADHNFTTWGTLELLFKETLQWVRKY